MFRFEWDPRKAVLNLRKHGISLDEAASVFGDIQSLTISDPDSSLDEARFITLGRSNVGRLLAVVHTERDDKIRLISARRASPRERANYEETIS